MLAEGAGLQTRSDWSNDELHKKRDRCRISQIPIGSDFFPSVSEGTQYGRLFTGALKEHNMLCIGLYRLLDPVVSKKKRYVVTNPPLDLLLKSSDLVKISLHNL